MVRFASESMSADHESTQFISTSIFNQRNEGAATTSYTEFPVVTTTTKIALLVYASPDGSSASTS